jgi:formamidopyrimidine-DNA glycosylase
MPELPEVETIRRALSADLPGKKIRRILVRDARLRWPVQKRKLSELVVDNEISNVSRRAKYLLIGFQNDVHLIMHLGMSGRVLLLREKKTFDKHDHVIFYFNDRSQMRFRDPRRFGMVEAVGGDIDAHPRLANLGYEPLGRTTRSARLFEKANNLKRPIKNLLMDANFIVGVGNIYASEALFRAGIHPAMPSNLLSSSDWQRLLTNIRRVLNKAIQKGGTTLNDFVNSNGEMGYFQLSLAVYDREGQPCPKCRSKIERVVQVGRSTYFCGRCQPFDPNG